jgi:hypothetical protein
MSTADVAALASEATNWKARLIALGTAVVGVILAGLSSRIETIWIQSTALALATTIISIGALSLLFDLALRRTVYREMLRIVGIKTNIIEQHIASGGKSTSVDWSPILASRSQISLLLLDPLSWCDQNLGRLLENGRQRRLSVEFFLPDPNASYIQEVAQALNIAPDTLKHTMSDASNRIERSWMALRSEGRLVNESSLTIRLVQNRPLYSIILVDEVTVISMTGVVGRSGADADYSYVHIGDRGSFPSSWFREQVARLEQLPIRFENRIQS